LYRGYRDRFFERRLEYACSFDTKLCFEGMAPDAEGYSLLFRAAAPRDAGCLFHVADAATVLGADGKSHDCPSGRIVSVEEQASFHADARDGAVTGRLTFETEDAAIIDTRYSGVLRLSRSPRQLPEPGTELKGLLWLTLNFCASHSRYQWLNEHACVANGRWLAQPGGASGRAIGVATEIDVYSAR